MTRLKTLCMVVSMIGISGCQRGTVVDGMSTQRHDFESGLNEQKLPEGWQTHINDGYNLELDTGFQQGSQALKLDGEGFGKAVMLFQKITTKQPINARFVLSGHLQSAYLNGETALYLRVFSNDQLIHQDDMRAYALSGSQTWTEVTIRSPHLTAITAIEFGVLALGDGTVWVDDLSFSQMTGEQVSPVAAEYANQSLELIKADSIYPIDLAAEKQYFDSLKGAQVVDDVHGSLVLLLREIGDEHASFIPAKTANEQSSQSDADTADQQSIDHLPIALHKLAGLGYIKIPGFDKDTGDAEVYVEAARDVYLELQKSARCGWVVDLRGNSGGSMWPMLAAVAPLLDAETVGYMMDSKGDQTPWRLTQYEVMLGETKKQRLGFDRTALQQALFDDNRSRRVVVLLDDNTASSAEAVAMAFRGQNEVTFLGKPTSGFTTGISLVELPDGSLVRLSIAHFADRNKQTYPAGLEPDVQAVGTRQVIDQSYQYLTTDQDCGLPEGGGE
jgi:carboxyl-terminal processing protease